MILRFVSGCARSLVAALALLACVRAGEPPPGDPAKIQSLIRDLESRDASTREAATRELEAIGEPAAQALQQASRSSDAEVALRAQQVLNNMRWIPPALREKIEKLRSTREADAWTRLWNEICAAGESARYRLEQELNTPYGEAVMKVEGAPRHARRGQGYPVQVTIRNEGKRGFWIQKDRIRLHKLVDWRWSASKVDVEAAGAFGGIMRFAMLAGAGGPGASEPAPVPYVYLAPGESYTHTVEIQGKDLDFIGRCKVQVLYGGSEGYGFSDINMLIARARGGMAAETAVDARPLARDLFAESGWIDLLPELGRSSEGMTLSLADPATPANDGTIRVSLQNTGQEAVSVPRPEPGRAWGFWYVLLDANEMPVRSGPLDGRDEKGEHGLKISLGSGKKVSASGPLPTDLPAGGYKLVCGYSAHPAAAASAAGGVLRIPGVPQQPEEAAPEAKEWVGDTLTKPVRIEIKR